MSRPFRHATFSILRAIALMLTLAWGLPAWAQHVVVSHAHARINAEGDLLLDADLRFELAPVFEQAQNASVPLVYNAQVNVLGKRWYWRDVRVTNDTRSWRLQYQPLTETWRITALKPEQTSSQSHESLNSALLSLARIRDWPIASKAELASAHDRKLYVEFSFKLDTNQLPTVLRASATAQKWQMGAEQTLAVERP